jgi:hypothetical protein
VCRGHRLPGAELAAVVANIVIERHGSSRRFARGWTERVARSVRVASFRMRVPCRPLRSRRASAAPAHSA